MANKEISLNDIVKQLGDFGKQLNNIINPVAENISEKVSDKVSDITDDTKKVIDEVLGTIKGIKLSEDDYKDLYNTLKYTASELAEALGVKVTSLYEELVKECKEYNKFSEKDETCCTCDSCKCECEDSCKCECEDSCCKCDTKHDITVGAKLKSEYEKFVNIQNKNKELELQKTKMTKFVNTVFNKLNADYTDKEKPYTFITSDNANIPPAVKLVFTFDYNFVDSNVYNEMATEIKNTGDFGIVTITKGEKNSNNAYEYTIIMTI